MINKKLFFTFILILVVATGFYVVYERYLKKVDSLQGFMDLRHPDLIPFERFGREFGVHSIDDVAYANDKDKIVLYFGKFIFDIYKEDLQNERVINNLYDINIKIYRDRKTGKYRFKYDNKYIKEVPLEGNDKIENIGEQMPIRTNKRK